MPADIIPADERPDAEYPMVLITGRQLEHWHTGSMTRRADGARRDRARSGGARSIRSTWPRSACKPGDVVTIESRRGKVALYARADDGSPRGAVFVPFCYYEAAINLLTNRGARPVRARSRSSSTARSASRWAARRRRRAASAAARRWPRALSRRRAEDPSSDQ